MFWGDEPAFTKPVNVAMVSLPCGRDHRARPRWHLAPLTRGGNWPVVQCLKDQWSQSAPTRADLTYIQMATVDATTEGLTATLDLQPGKLGDLDELDE